MNDLIIKIYWPIFLGESSTFFLKHHSNGFIGNWPLNFLLSRYWCKSSVPLCICNVGSNLGFH